MSILSALEPFPVATLVFLVFAAFLAVLITFGGVSAYGAFAARRLGEEVRRRVKANSGIELEWEIQRVGRP